MGSDPGSRRWGALLALTAAFVWASYYVFVLWLGPIASPSAVLVYPFLIGGLGFLAIGIWQGDGRSFVALWSDGWAWVRVLLAVIMQIATLAATYTAGPIDSSLLALLGDVVMVPLLLMAIYREDRPLARSTWYLGGVLVCLLGGGLTIVGGHTVSPIGGWAILVVPAIPLTIGFYFLLTARAARTTSAVVLNAQAFLGAGIVTAILSPLFPGGAVGLWVPNISAVTLLLVTGLTTFLFAPFLYFVAIRRDGLVPTAIWMSFIPAFTVLLTVLVLGLAPVLIAVLGVPVAIVGALLALEGQRKVNAAAEPSRTG